MAILTNGKQFTLKAIPSKKKPLCNLNATQAIVGINYVVDVPSGADIVSVKDQQGNELISQVNGNVLQNLTLQPGECINQLYILIEVTDASLVKCPLQIGGRFELPTSCQVDKNACTYHSHQYDCLTCECIAECVPNSVGNLTQSTDGVITVTYTDGTTQDLFINEVDSDFISLLVSGSVVTFTSEDGTSTPLDICQIVADNCNATLVDNGDGTVTFTDNAGGTTSISIAHTTLSEGNNITIVSTTNADGSTNYEISGCCVEISPSDPGTLLITDSSGNVSTFVLPDDSTYVSTNSGNVIGTHISGSGTSSTIEETITSVTDNGDGTYTFNHEDGSTSSIQGGFTTVTDNGDNTTTFTYPDGTTVAITACCPTLVENADGSYTFTNGDGTIVTIQKEQYYVPSSDADGNTIFTDQDGNVVYNIPASNTSSFSQDATTGIITHDSGDGGTPSTANVVSVDADNIAVVGTDGGAKVTCAIVNGCVVTTADITITNPNTGLPITIPSGTNLQDALTQLANAIVTTEIQIDDANTSWDATTSILTITETNSDVPLTINFASFLNIVEGVTGSGVLVVPTTNPDGSITYTIDLDLCQALTNVSDNGNTVVSTDKVLVKQADGSCEMKTVCCKSSDLELTKTVTPTSAVVGTQVVYTITVTNNGPDEDSGIYVTDVLPNQVDYVSDNSGGNYYVNNGIWLVGTLANGASASLEITAEVNSNAEAGEDIINSAFVKGNNLDTNITNSIDSTSIEVLAPPVSTIESVSTDGGENYTVTVGQFEADGTTPVDCSLVCGSVIEVYAQDSDSTRVLISTLDWNTSSSTFTETKEVIGTTAFSEWDISSGILPYLTTVNSVGCAGLSEFNFPYRQFSVDMNFLFGSSKTDGSQELNDYRQTISFETQFCYTTDSNVAVTILDGGGELQDSHQNLFGISWNDGDNVMLGTRDGSGAVNPQGLQMIFPNGVTKVIYKNGISPSIGTSTVNRTRGIAFDHFADRNGFPIIYRNVATGQVSFNGETGIPIVEHSRNNLSSNVEAENWDHEIIGVHSYVTQDGTSTLSYGTSASYLHADPIEQRNGRSVIYSVSSVTTSASTFALNIFHYNGTTWDRTSVNPVLTGQNVSIGSVYRINNPLITSASGGVNDGDLIMISTLGKIFHGAWTGGDVTLATSWVFSEILETPNLSGNSSETKTLKGIPTGVISQGSYTSFADSNGNPVFLISDQDDTSSQGAIRFMKYNPTNSEWEVTLGGQPDGYVALSGNTNTVNSLMPISEDQLIIGTTQVGSEINEFQLFDYDPVNLTATYNCTIAGQRGTKNNQETIIWGAQDPSPFVHCGN